MDAVSFVMGEKTSSLRVKRLADLIHGASIHRPVSRRYRFELRYELELVFGTRCYCVFDFSASVTAVFRLEDGSEKHFQRIVQGQSSEHRINSQVCCLSIRIHSFVVFIRRVLCEFNINSLREHIDYILSDSFIFCDIHPLKFKQTTVCI